MPRVSTKKDATIEVKKVSKKTVRKPRVLRKKNEEVDIFSDKPKKRISLSDLKPVAIKNRTRNKKKTTPEIAIVLPEKIDSKLIKKVNFYKDLVSNRTPKIMRIIANVGGYTFIISGIYLGFLITDIKEEKGSDLLALTSCVTANCTSIIDSSLSTVTNVTTTTSTTQNLSSTQFPEPKVLFSSDFPREPEADFSIKIETQEASDIWVMLTSDSSSESVVLTTKGNNEYYVPVSILKPGIYTFRAKVLALDKITKYYVSGGKFTIKSPEPTPVVTTDTASDSSSETITTTETDTFDVEKEEVLSEEVQSEVAEPETVNPTLEVHKLFGDNNFRFLTKNIPDSRFVEVYAQPKLSNNPRFLGLAIKRDNIWVYHFNGDSLPVGNYEVFIRASISGNIFKSEPAQFSVTKPIETTTPQIIQNTDEVASPIILSEKIKRTFEEQDSSTTTSNISLLEKRIAYFEKSDEESTSPININSTTTTLQMEGSVRKEAVELLNKDKDKLNRLLKRYASTLQGEDKNLNRRAKEEIIKFRDSLVTESAINTKTKDISAQIATELDREIERLQNKVERYETLIKERSELVSKDSDNDGITDFDEVNLYKTDAMNPDTDGDGVLDGVEIVGGYNPNDADLEAIIAFHSPKDVNYIDDENMKIESVSPIIETDTEQGGVPILTEIKGKALPNSFVTLFIYSSPTVVSVKTDANGDFVYTFTKELEDGDHEVYIAVTDNKGEIVVRSNPFQFVKTAEAFTPVDAKDSEVVNYDEYYENTELSSYNIVAAMGIVSFGLILLMLGHTLKNRPEKIVEGENVENKQNDTGS